MLAASPSHADASAPVTVEQVEIDDEEAELIEQMKRLGLPTEFGAAPKRHKQQPVPLTSPASSVSATPAATQAVGRGSKAQRKRQWQQQQHQRGEQDAAQRWQHQANKQQQDVYDNPSYVGKAMAASEMTEESKQADEVRVVWEEEEEAKEAEWQWQEHHERNEHKSADWEAGTAGKRAVQCIVAQQAASTQHHLATQDEQAYAYEGGKLTEGVDDADDYQAGVSLYPHGYGRFADQPPADYGEDDGAEDDALMDGDGEAEQGDKGEKQQQQDDGEEDDEHVDDYGLIQGEVLWGEDHTDEPPASPHRRLRGLPAARGKRVRMDEDGNEVSEQLASSEAEVEQRAAGMDNEQEGNERPDELPVLVSRSPLQAPLPSPPTSLAEPLASLSSSLPASALLPLPHAAVAPTTLLLPPPSYPLSLLPTRFTAAIVSAASDDDADADEYVRAHASELIEGEDRTAVPIPPKSTSTLRGMPRRNKRVVFDADGQQVVAEKLTELASRDEHEGEKAVVEVEMKQASSENGNTMVDTQHNESSTTDTATVLPADPNLAGVDVHPKYYAQRYRLFSRYDAGVRLDAVGWYSVTPEAIAVHIAARVAASLQRSFTVIDAFAGLGGNTIAFASHPLCRRVIAVELDAHRLSLAQHNAAVYGVAGKVEWMAGDWLQLQHSDSVQADVLFLAPPWGGVQYQHRDTYKMDEVEVEGGGRRLIADGIHVRGVAGRVAVSLPRNVDVGEVVSMGGGSRVEVEYNRCNWKVKTVTAYYGELVRGTGSTAYETAAQTVTASLSFHDVFVGNASLLRLLATFLCYTNLSPAHRSRGLDNSLLALSRCCRRAHSLLATDGPWWHHQRIDMILRRPVISRHAWANVLASSTSTPSLGLLARGFTGRQQAIARRMMGDEAYERQVGSKLIVERCVAYECDDERLLAHMEAQCWRVDDEDSDLAAESGEKVDVYSQLTPSAFVTSTFPCTDAQWLFGSYDAVLLSPSARFIPAARVVMNMPNALRSDQQIESVFRAMQVLPSLAHVRMDWRVSDEDNDAFVCQPRHHCAYKRPDRGLDQFPFVRSLHIKDMYLSWGDSFLPIIRHSGLVQLRLSSVSVLGEQQDWARNDVSYQYPRRSRGVTELLAMDPEQAARQNRRLRRAFCAYIVSAMSTVARCPLLQQLLDAVYEVQGRLSAQQHADDALTADDEYDGPEMEQLWDDDTEADNDDRRKIQPLPACDLTVPHRPRNIDDAVRRVVDVTLPPPLLPPPLVSTTDTDSRDGSPLSSASQPISSTVADWATHCSSLVDAAVAHSHC